MRATGDNGTSSVKWRQTGEMMGQDGRKMGEQINSVGRGEWPDKTGGIGQAARGAIKPGIVHRRVQGSKGISSRKGEGTEARWVA